MRLASGEIQYLKQLAEKIRPLMLLADADMQIAMFCKALVDDSIGRAVDQTARELVRTATTVINARKRAIARAVAEGIPE